ncbi:hypothetical protein KP509_02G089300 [Ceratopteris richardii]|uniref:Uncharacterized protein n=1 Tax=Ceratopteris richardii TaxID=49495 RepID=A0A8T2VG66_CERRI|nr:hypothetical protein KP509_02G089300 [Ceratopteris richardii]KAH7444713.1 hypothetical protein KP509_02G089300 [Ceratopteris richardii]
MVKLAQHIEWSTPIRSKLGEGLSSSERKKGGSTSANGTPRRTLADLFDSRATSPSSSSISPSRLSSTSSPSSKTVTRATVMMARTQSSLSSSGTRTPPVASSTSFSRKTSLGTSVSFSGLASSTSMQAHVTFDDKHSNSSHRQSHKPSIHQNSDSAGSVKRSSSARKIADSSRHEGTRLQSNHPPKKSSLMGALARSPLIDSANANSTQKRRPLDPKSLQVDAHSGERSTQKPGVGHKGSSSIAASILTGSDQRNESPFGKFWKHEHIRGNLLQKSLDTVETIQNLSRSGMRGVDPSFAYRMPHMQSDSKHTSSEDKKVRKGLFGLLIESRMVKHPSGEEKGSPKLTRKVSVNLGRDANLQQRGDHIKNLETSLPVSPSSRVDTRHADIKTQSSQHSPRINSGQLHISEECLKSTSLTVEIPDKMVGLAWIDSKPHVLSPGSYTFPTNRFSLEQVVSEKSTYLRHETLHRVHIPEGHLGVAWVDGKATLLEAGVSVHTCPPDRFSYIITDEKMLLEKEFVLGPFRVVTVDESEVGIKFCNRKPQILCPGRHFLSISKVEVFVGFESLLRRQSCVSKVNALSMDNKKVSADIWLEWQIKAEDAAAARVANITDVEEAVCNKVQRAFNLVIWEMSGHDVEQPLTQSMGGSVNEDSHPMLKILSSNICRECHDLFEEGWSVTIWDLQVRHIAIEPTADH